MDKNFKRLIYIFTAVIILLPLLLNFLVLYCYIIPSVGDNSVMFQALTGYFGGAIGGLTTLITIYFTIIKSRVDRKPLLYFNDFSTYYYVNLSGIDSYFIKTYFNTDKEIIESNERINFELSNIGSYPALDLDFLIINLKDFKNSLRLLRTSNEFFERLRIPDSLDNYQYFKKSLLKQDNNLMLPTTNWFSMYIDELIYAIKENSKSGNEMNNNCTINGRFKLFDIQAKYKDIDNYHHKDIFSLHVRIDRTVQLTSNLRNFEPWVITVEFEKQITKQRLLSRLLSNLNSID